MRLCPHLHLPATPFRTDGSTPRPELPEPERGGDWPRSEAVRYGLDLLNHGFPWEAHEVWEQPWRERRVDEPLACEFLQALIQVAAARVLARDGRVSGAERVAARAREHLERSAVAAERFDLDPRAVRAAVEACTLVDVEHPPLCPGSP